MRWFALLLLLAAVFPAGCATTRDASPWMALRATAEVPIDYPPDADAARATAPRDVPWRGRTISVYESAGVRPAGASEFPGLASAEARLAAADRARAALREQVMELPADNGHSLGDWAVSHPGVATAIHAAVSSASLALALVPSEDGLVGEARGTLALASLADALLASGGGIQPPPDPDLLAEVEAARRDAELAAQRRALDQARASLAESFLLLPVRVGKRPADFQAALRRNPALAPRAAAIVREARVVESTPTPEGTWRIAIEANPQPLHAASLAAMD